MSEWFFRGNPYLDWPLIGLAIFIVAFAAVLLYVFVVLRDGDEVARTAALPLDDDKAAPRREGSEEL